MVMPKVYSNKHISIWFYGNVDYVFKLQEYATNWKIEKLHSDPRSIFAIDFMYGMNSLISTHFHIVLDFFPLTHLKME